MQLPPREDLFDAALPEDAERLTVGGNRFDHRPSDYVPSVAEAFSPDALARFDVSRDGSLAVGDRCPEAVLWNLEENQTTSLMDLLRLYSRRRVVLNFGSYS